MDTSTRKGKIEVIKALLSGRKQLNDLLPQTFIFFVGEGDDWVCMGPAPYTGKTFTKAERDSISSQAIVFVKADETRVNE